MTFVSVIFKRQVCWGVYCLCVRHARQDLGEKSWQSCRHFFVPGLRATFFAVDELVKLFTLLLGITGRAAKFRFLAPNFRCKTWRPYAVSVILMFIGAKLVRESSGSLWGGEDYRRCTHITCSRTPPRPGFVTGWFDLFSHWIKPPFLDDVLFCPFVLSKSKKMKKNWMRKLQGRLQLFNMKCPIQATLVRSWEVGFISQRRLGSIFNTGCDQVTWKHDRWQVWFCQCGEIFSCLKVLHSTSMTSLKPGIWHVWRNCFCFAVHHNLKLWSSAFKKKWDLTSRLEGRLCHPGWSPFGE